MRGWYALDEGGESGPGAWPFLRTTWDPKVAMPHGWALAELALLIRDCLVFELGDRLVLLGGTPSAWFDTNEGLSVRDLPTHFGMLSMEWRRTEQGGILELGDGARPPGGFLLRLPPRLVERVLVDGRAAPADRSGGWTVPARVSRVGVRFRGQMRPTGASIHPGGSR
jgi:hypothetical protein